MNFLNIPSLRFAVRFPQLILQRKTLAPRTSAEHVITGTNLNAKWHATCFYTKTVTILPVDTATVLDIHRVGSCQKHFELRICNQLGKSWQVWQGHAHRLGLLCRCLNAPETVLPDSPGSSSHFKGAFFPLSFGWERGTESSQLNVGEGKQRVASH